MRHRARKKLRTDLERRPVGGFGGIVEGIIHSVVGVQEIRKIGAADVGLQENHSYYLILKFTF